MTGITKEAIEAAARAMAELAYSRLNSINPTQEKVVGTDHFERWFSATRTSYIEHSTAALSTLPIAGLTSADDAFGSWWDSDGKDPHRAFTAGFLSGKAGAPIAGEGKVKALEWEHNNADKDGYDKTGYAKVPWGRYEVFSLKLPSTSVIGYCVPMGKDVTEGVGSYDEAVAKCEDHYRTFVWSLLTSSTGKDGGQEVEAVADLGSYYERQIAWSRETFGPSLRTKGVIDHIRKELGEIEQDPHDLSEWVDVVILAMDGFWRHGGAASDLFPALLAKQKKNMARAWPDWRTMSEDQAIEHDRSQDATPPPQSTVDAELVKRLANHCQSLVDIIDDVQLRCDEPVYEDDMEMVRHIEEDARAAISEKVGA